MPISRREFEGRRLDPSPYVEGLFQAYPDTAFTAHEIWDALGQQGRSIAEEEIDQILSTLITEGRIESADVGGVLHYIHRRRPLGFRLG
jgi:hypothetical protein